MIKSYINTIAAITTIYIGLIVAFMAFSQGSPVGGLLSAIIAYGGAMLYGYVRKDCPDIAKLTLFNYKLLAGMFIGLAIYEYQTADWVWFSIAFIAFIYYAWCSYTQQLWIKQRDKEKAEQDAIAEQDK